MTRLAAHGIELDVPRGWEARIVRRAVVNPREVARPVTHIASFPLPEARGDFGVGVTELMRSGDVFVSLFEYGPESVGRVLFATQGVPKLEPAMFSPQRLQRTRPGQLGCQLFFTAAQRPFCLYVVVSGKGHVPNAVEQVNTMLARLELTA